MKGSYRTPGVYVRWQDAPVASATSPARLDIAGFVGIAARGPIGVPVRLESWSDFIGMFGDVIPEAYLGYAVRGFFQNGGRACWVVRTADPAASFPAKTYLLNEDRTPIAHLFAATPGSWGSGIQVTMAHRGAHHFDLTVTLGGEAYENWRNLSLAPGDENFIEKVLGRERNADAAPGQGSRLIRARVWYPTSVTGDQLAPAGFLAAETAGRAEPRIALSTCLRGGTDGLQPCAIVKGFADGGFFANYLEASHAFVQVRNFTLQQIDGVALQTTGEQQSDDSGLQDLNVLEVRPLGHAADDGLPTLFSVTVSPADTAERADAFRLTLTTRTATNTFEHHAIGQSAAWPEGRPLSLNADSPDYVLTQLALDRDASQMVEIRDLHPWPGRAVQLIRTPGQSETYGVGDGLTISQFAAVAPGGGVLPPGTDDEPPAIDMLGDIWEIGLIAAPDLMPKPRVQAAAKVCRCDLPDGPAETPARSRRGQPPEFTVREIHDAQEAMLRHCLAERYRFAILDSPPPMAAFAAWQAAAAATDTAVSADDTAVESVIEWRQAFGGPASQFGALYFPWLAVPAGAEGPEDVRIVPPSGHVAGVYARTDTHVGVHKAPANETLAGTQATVIDVPEPVQGYLNAEDVNVIKAIPGRGIRVFGARTLVQSSSVDASSWRYVNVRRLVSMIEKTIDVSTQWTVFEPNDHRLWRTLDRIARSLLTGLWRRGMLDGATAADAFFVRCDDATNPIDQVDQGVVVTEIGLRPPWPAEFITLRLVRTAAETATLALTEDMQ